MQEITPIKWEDANFKWNNNPYTWDEVQLVIEIISGPGEFDEEIYKFNNKRKQKLIKLILKIQGNTITESKKKEIKQYKIKAKDIRIIVKEVLGVEMIAENVTI
tara:strand:- start:48 stop:359 length:312 start_codon:yes stop_codon:yes gene_type:complete